MSFLHFNFQCISIWVETINSNYKNSNGQSPRRRKDQKGITSTRKSDFVFMPLLVFSLNLTSYVIVPILITYTKSIFWKQFFYFINVNKKLHYYRITLNYNLIFTHLCLHLYNLYKIKRSHFYHLSVILTIL